MAVKTVNLEQGMPTVAVARQRMTQALRTAKMAHTPAVKLIHGYGSSGRGGAIRDDVRRELEAMRRSGVIRVYAKGEEFSPFYPDARRAVDLCPELARDRDYNNTNHGITIVVL